MQKKMNYIVLGVSLAFLFYIVFVAAPFAEKYGFTRGNSSPQQDKVLFYFLLTLPALLAYIAFILKHLRKTTFLSCINYPLSIIAFVFGGCFCLIVMGGDAMWIFVFLFPVIFIMLIISFIMGCRKDYKYWKNRKQRS